MFRKKIIFIPGETYPIPPVNGGAVESLIYSLVVENEIKQRYDFVVYSKYDEAAEKNSKKYRYTCFRYVRNSGLVYKAKCLLKGVLNKFVGRWLYFGNSYIESIFRDPYANGASAVVVENVPIYTISVKKYAKTKVILHCHNLISRLRSPYLNRCILNSVDIFWGISNYVCDDIIMYSRQYGVFNKDVKNFYNCFDANNPLYDMNVAVGDDVLNKYELPHTKKMFIYAGRVQPYKGVKELLSAFVKVQQEDCILVIVGGTFFKNSLDDDYVHELKELSFGRMDVFFTGYIDHDDLLRLYRHAYAAVIPSLWEEPFALTCLEPMACSVPVIISDAGGMVEVVDEKSSVIVKRDDKFVDKLAKAMYDVSTNVHMRNEMGVAAKKRSELFTSKKYYNRFMELVDL